MRTNSNVPNLNTVINYRNPAVLARYREKLGLSEAEAIQLFEDTKKFLFLVTQNDCISPTSAIDNGWHEFLMFTQDYADFCREILGKFIHHVPTPTLGNEKGKNENRESVVLIAERFFGTNLSSNWIGENALCCPNPNCEGKSVNLLHSHHHDNSVETYSN